MSWKEKFPADERFFETENGILYNGNALEVLSKIPDESVDCIITSPPYWRLRDYGSEANTIWGGSPDCDHEWEIMEIKRNGQSEKATTKTPIKGLEINQKHAFCKKCGAWYGQLGLEPTLEMYLDHLLQIMKELKRILKKTGIIYWNHGDCYGGNNSRASFSGRTGFGNPRECVDKRPVPFKCMALQNYRFLIKCVDELGLIVRNIIVWYKPNAMPCSARDRLGNTYEPVFMLVKSPKYWFDLDAIRLPQKLEKAGSKRGRKAYGLSNGIEAKNVSREYVPHPLGKNPGDLWSIPTQPLPDAHFAVYPPRLIEPMIISSCPPWICKKCGKARERIVEERPLKNSTSRDSRFNGEIETVHPDVERYTVGWTDCGCNAGWEPGVVLDPFMGSGTTAVVAEKLGRRWIGIEINHKYCEMSHRKIKKETMQKKLFQVVVM